MAGGVSVRDVDVSFPFRPVPVLPLVSLLPFPVHSKSRVPRKLEEDEKWQR